MTEALIDWFERGGRDLPWRSTREPWPILVSELMLQQTQVARVIDRWPRFLARFPTPTACASAPTADVIDEWSGLGYNRRAVNLHRAAVAIRDEHGGAVPGEMAALLALPGVGPYTARAVRVFAFETDDAVVDTNIGRVLARWTGDTLSTREAQERADSLVPAGSGWVWNQALMEVGALVCRPAPLCDRCPLASECRWLAGGRNAPDPAIGSASVSTGQSRFRGSDREGRGRLVRRLRDGPVDQLELAPAMGWPADPGRAEAVVGRMIADGIVIRTRSGFELPS